MLPGWLARLLSTCGCTIWTMQRDCRRGSFQAKTAATIYSARLSCCTRTSQPDMPQSSQCCIGLWTAATAGLQWVLSGLQPPRQAATVAQLNERSLPYRSLNDAKLPSKVHSEQPAHGHSTTATHTGTTQQHATTTKTHCSTRSDTLQHTALDWLLLQNMTPLSRKHLHLSSADKAHALSAEAAHAAALHFPV